MKIVFYLFITVCTLKATNTLANWKPVQTVSQQLIWNITFADNNTIYAIGDSLLMKSIDGGTTWLDLIPNIASVTDPNDFYNLYFLNKDTGFIFRRTSSENLFMTKDGGITWTNITSSAMLMGLLDLQMTSPLIGYTAHGFFGNDIIAKTIDGGLTWNNTTKPTLCDAPMTIKFLNDSVGFTGDMEIYKTTDGGATWNLTICDQGWPISNAYKDRISNFYFINDNIGFAIRDDWHVYKTIDGGKNWQLTYLPVANSGGASDIWFDVDFIGYITGYGLFQPLISTDNGTSWQIDGTYNANFPATCMAVSKDNKVVIGTRGGTVMLRESSPLSNLPTDALKITKLYPNPNKGKFTLTTSKGIQHIEVINMMGKTIYSKDAAAGTTTMEVDLGHHSSGLYILRIRNTAETMHQQLVLE